LDFRQLGGEKSNQGMSRTRKKGNLFQAEEGQLEKKRLQANGRVTYLSKNASIVINDEKGY